MNKQEAAGLLTIAGAFDRWITVNDATATAWAYALADVPVDLARVAVLEHYKGADAHKQIMPADIIKAVEREARLTRPQVEADFERLVQETAAREIRKITVRDAADQVELFKNPGYSIDGLMKDIRFKVSATLAEAGLHNTAYGQELLRGLGNQRGTNNVII
jgi:hypothetical protein